VTRGTAVVVYGGHVMVVTNCQPTAVPAAVVAVHTVTARCHYYSTTSNGVKLLSVPESSSPELYATATVQA